VPDCEIIVARCKLQVAGCLVLGARKRSPMEGKGWVKKQGTGLRINAEDLKKKNIYEEEDPVQPGLPRYVAIIGQISAKG